VAAVVKTRIYPPAGVHGFGRYRTVGVVAQPLDGIDGFCLVTYLADHGIPLRVVEDHHHVVHLHALAPMTTAQEVCALRAFAAVTDQRLAWHEAVA
jgi:hypothetical protein